MQTQLLQSFLQTDSGQRANDILRKCVHCGFCTATCPTYQLLGDELDSPRGRIYQVKQMLEGQSADRETLIHFDRCLTCRSCETTCPSGVDYAQLIDIGRLHLERQNIRPLWQRLIRHLLGTLLPSRSLNYPLFALASRMRPFLPSSLAAKAPQIRPAQSYKTTTLSAKKTVLLLEGCVQSTISPNTNAAAAAVLQALGYRVIRQDAVSCCGAVNHHLNQAEKTHKLVLDNLRHWQEMDQRHPLDAIISTASGCGTMLKDYPELLSDMPELLAQHQGLLSKIRDISELFEAKALLANAKGYQASQQSIAFHAPCTLTHGQKLATPLFKELVQLGYQLNIPQDAHLCCGSAGTYSLLQPTLSRQLRENKLNALQACIPELIITANVGCEHHLNSASEVPVIHWVELIANDLELQ